MAFGFHSRPSHVAQNIIVGLDFDGTIAYGQHLRIWYAKNFYNTNLTLQQTTHKGWPKELGEEKYLRMALAVENEYMMNHILAPGCREVLTQLHSQGFKFAVVTARILTEELIKAKIKTIDIKRKAAKYNEGVAAVNFITHHKLPVDYIHFTNQNPKEWLCSKLHARAFIDDGIKYLVSLRETFVKPFFILQPWNIEEARQIPASGVTPVKNWIEFGRWLLYIKQVHEAICYFNKWENAYFNLPKIAAFWKSYPDKCNAHLQEYKKEKAGAFV